MSPSYLEYSYFLWRRGGAERYCVDPPPPPVLITEIGIHFGTRDWNAQVLSGITPFQHKVEYQCGPGRQFQHVLEEEEETYREHVKECQWNGSWTPSGVCTSFLYLRRYYERSNDGHRSCCSSSYFFKVCLLYTSPSPRDRQKSRMPSSA